MEKRGPRTSPGEGTALRSKKPPRIPSQTSLPAWQATRPTLELFLPVTSSPLPSDRANQPGTDTLSRQPSSRSQAASEGTQAGKSKRLQKPASPSSAPNKTSASSTSKLGARRIPSSKSLQALAAAAQAAAGSSDHTEGVATSSGSKDKPRQAGKKRALEAEEDDESEADPDTRSGENSQGAKRARLVWTAELHARFMRAMNHLGVKNAVPKTILQLMNVEGMTRENVASHLQKYRQYLKRMAGYPANVKVSHEELQKIQQNVMEHAAAQQALQQSFGFLPMPTAATHPSLPQLQYGGLGLMGHMGQAGPFDLSALTAAQLPGAQLAQQAHYELAAMQPAAAAHLQASPFAQQQLNGLAGLPHLGLHAAMPTYPPMPWLQSQPAGLPIFCQGYMMQESAGAAGLAHHQHMHALQGYAAAGHAMHTANGATNGLDATAQSLYHDGGPPLNESSGTVAVPPMPQGMGETAIATSTPAVNVAADPSSCNPHVSLGNETANSNAAAAATNSAPAQAPSHAD